MKFCSTLNSLCACITRLITNHAQKRKKIQSRNRCIKIYYQKVLSQKQEEKQKLIAFLSKTMQVAERNYKIYVQELLAIVDALTKCKQYLLDATEKFEV